MLTVCLSGSWIVGGPSLQAQEPGQEDLRTPDQKVPGAQDVAAKDDQTLFQMASPTTGEESEGQPEVEDQETGADDTAGAAKDVEILKETVEAPVAAVGTRAPRDPTTYGLWVIIPAILAILLAIVTRQVVLALVVGVLAGAYMMVPCLAASDAFAGLNSIVAGFRLASERYILGAIIDPRNDYGHIKIIFFTLVIGFMIGVIGRNGGTRGMVNLVAGETKSQRRGALTAWIAGLVVFFDDYANTMIVGPTMQSVFDRVKLSRAKLAYIVDSTAAPVASIALIGTWVGAEIGYIQSGIDAVAQAGTAIVDPQGNAISGMQAFLYSIPYRFYPILALVLVFLIALTGRDFGPMKRSERKILSKIDRDPVTPVASGKSKPAEPRARWWLGLLPVATLVIATIVVLVITGTGADKTVAAMSRVGPDGMNVWAQTSWWEKASTVISNADAYLSIFYGAILSALAAVLTTLIVRACPVRDTVDAGVEGMTRMFAALIILTLAWALSQVLQDLMLGKIVAGYLHAYEFPAQWLPLAVFLCAALISFATGTSWGTMGILCPMVVEIGARVTGGLEASEAISLFYASVGSVLAGAVFGDHCSPISDTTVLSSIASGCRHEEHVWTQIPYALVTAVAAMALGDVMCSVYGQPWYLGMAAGVVLLLLVVFTVGRRPVPSFDLADA